MKVQGVWLPIITPFKDGLVDYESYKRMINYYIQKGIDGIMPLATTGESPTLSEIEYEKLLSKTTEYVNGRLPIIVGLSGNDTRKVIKELKIVEKYGVDGILSACPYYNRPDQRGIYEHFSAIADETKLGIIVYNIPYRTGRNIENSTIYKLADKKNIIGLKDCSGDIKQTMDLLLNPPKEFSIMTGEDILFYLSLALGAQGGILASSHLYTEDFITVYNKIKNNDHEGALKVWKKLQEFIPLLFAEPNPAPLKYCLNKIGLIDSAEVRLPLMEITDSLKSKLNNLI